MSRRSRSRRKPSISVKETKDSLKIVKTMYDEFGKVLKKQIDVVVKK